MRVCLARRARTGLQLTMAVLAVVTVGVARGGTATATPNLILILTDDQGYGDMSCHGNPILRTPNIDRLHDEGVRFLDFHVSPTCSPTRAAMMTGRCPQT